MRLGLCMCGAEVCGWGGVCGVGCVGWDAWGGVHGVGGGGVCGGGCVGWVGWGVWGGVCVSALVLTFSPSNLHCSKCSASCSRVPSNVQLMEYTQDVLSHVSHMIVTCRPHDDLLISVVWTSHMLALLQVVMEILLAVDEK